MYEKSTVKYKQDR